GFSDGDCLEPEWRELPSAWLWIPELLWVRRAHECWLTRIWRDGAGRDIERRCRRAERAASRGDTAAAGERSVTRPIPDPAERRLAIDDDRFTAGALAGSAPRGRDRREDEQLGQALLACPKNRREHELVVAAVAASLAPVSAPLQVAEQPTLRLLPEAQHLAT